MKSVVLFGAGNVATHLFEAINNSQNFKVIQVYNHQPSSLKNFSDKVKTTTDLKEVLPADIYLLALKDEVIPAIVKQIIYREALVLHTSGATSISALDGFEKTGVFYPLQTFSKNKDLDISTVPFCIEAIEKENLLVVEKLAGELSKNVYQINSDQRKSLHLAAVFVNNFVNFLYSQGAEICNKNDVPFEILKPLIFETANKIRDLDPVDAQTGPAKREDSGVIKMHMEQLGGHQNKIYQLLTEAIQHQHGKKL